MIATGGPRQSAVCAFLSGSALCGVPLSRVTGENAEAGTPREPPGAPPRPCPGLPSSIGDGGCRHGGSRPKPRPRPHPAHRCRNSWKRMRLGKPWRQMRMPSRTPLQRSWSSTSLGSSFPACGQQDGRAVSAAGRSRAPLTRGKPGGRACQV